MSNISCKLFCKSFLLIDNRISPGSILFSAGDLGIIAIEKLNEVKNFKTIYLLQAKSVVDHLSHLLKLIDQCNPK